MRSSPAGRILALAPRAGIQAHPQPCWHVVPEGRLFVGARRVVCAARFVDTHDALCGHPRSVRFVDTHDVPSGQRFVDTHDVPPLDKARRRAPR